MEQMKRAIKLHYGEKWVEIELPEKQVLAVVEPMKVPGVSDELVEIERALDDPIGHKGLSALSRKGKSAIIICDDHTRPTPANKILPVLLKRLNDGGIKDEDIRILIATGTHRYITADEIEKKVGKEVTERIDVVKHHWKDDKTLVDLGKTPSGTPISVNKHVIEANIRIGMGNIVPHAVAGWGGGAKIIQPGVCGAETTGCTHWLSAQFTIKELLGVAENPVRREMEEVARRVGLDFIVNTILNEEMDIVKVVSGDLVKAHREGVTIAKKVYGARVQAKAKIVVCDSYPCDVDLWQAVKAIYAAELVVKKGGTIVLITPCREGVSSEHSTWLDHGFRSACPRPYDEIKQLIEAGEITDRTAATDLAIIRRLVAEKAKVILCSTGITEEETQKLNFDYAKTPQEAIDMAISRYDPKEKIVVLRSSGELLPVI
jgi:nickel-dependent lactate racemase